MAGEGCVEFDRKKMNMQWDRNGRYIPYEEMAAIAVRNV